MNTVIRERIEALYGRNGGAAVARQLAARLERFRARAGAGHEQTPRPLNETDALLIVYPDQVREPHVAPLRTLADFCARHLATLLSGVHILPFFPWSSDDGFAVEDYFTVAPEYGTWEDIAHFRPRFDLMFDAVFNHLSARSEWFERFLRDDPEFRDFFITVEGNPDLSRVVRPRALPLLTEFSGARGPLRVWTTFSADQVDLNFRNPRVLLAVIEALLFYVAQGARFIRLDAVAYLWKEIGTDCIHRPQTHAIIQLLRAVLDEVAPHVCLVTETNVPHAENVSYFGDGTNEAQLVYNFALPPLVLHALLRGDASHLSRWAATLRTPSDRTAFLNFLASHDGIGLNPARGILPEAEIEFLVERCRAHGGLIGWKHNADGTQSPYELNIVYFDALNDPGSTEPLATQVDRFEVAHAIMLSLAGVPAVYFHSLFGSRNDRQSALQSGIPRRINRQKLDRSELERELGDATSLRAQVFDRLRARLLRRRAHPAFAPNARQSVIETDRRVFALVREARNGERILCLHNVSGQHVELPSLEGLAGPIRLAPFEASWQELRHR